MRLALFQVFEPRVDYFLDAAQCGAPCLLRVVEAPINGVEFRVHLCPQVDEAGGINEDPYEYGDRGNHYGENDLKGLIGHRCHRHT